MNIYDLNEIYEMLKRNGYVEKEDNISSRIPRYKSNVFFNYW